ncbi:MAG: chaperonin family protein RbcX [Geminocystis sp.]|nr:chaperonin family protein RbcX [Geminocystis sp.]HIK38645.1 chaperonin family protein RbcX [Geminocystis sp. M7585_C2015_104]MCS7147609.1 chaperonin family protein RbcX [Geminocystis sp.]MCX8078012.1 chaperonin family protein RbcX [Geminocystis sp.]MDW8115302.1 chaperonin family protein RbcX [Geminocystis sp.]
MYYKNIAKDTARVLQSYLTYQAVKIIISQLSETNPQQAMWLSQYSDRTKVQDGESYLSQLLGENKELVLRILTVREDIANHILEFLPEMVKTNILQSNIEHRRRLLESLTQVSPNDSQQFHPEIDSKPLDNKEE